MDRFMCFRADNHSYLQLCQGNCSPGSPMIVALKVKPKSRKFDSGTEGDGSRRRNRTSGLLDSTQLLYR